MNRFGSHTRKIRISMCFVPLLALAMPALLPGELLARDRLDLPDGTEGISLLRLSGFSGWTEFVVRASREEADHYDIRETLVSPRLHLATNGSAYHERLLTFSLDGSLSLERHRVRGDVSGSNDLAFNDYNAVLSFFPDHVANLVLFARRTNSWIEAPYRSNYRVRSSGGGAELRTTRWLPLTLSYNHEKREEDQTNEDPVIERDQLALSAQHRAGIAQTDMTLRFVDFVQSIQPQDYETIGVGLNNTLRIPRWTDGRIRSSFRYFHQYGSIRRKSARLSEDVLWKWGNDVETVVQYHFADQAAFDGLIVKRDPQLTRSHRGSAQIRHTLYGSLESGLRLHLSQERIFDRAPTHRENIGENRRRGFRTDLKYHRRTPIGRLHLALGYDLAREHQASTDRLRTVSGESHLLTDGDEPELHNTRIDLATVVVTDDTGFILYQEGTDYRLVSFGNRVRIFRIPSGQIANGQTILVDYQFAFSPNLSFDTRGHLFSIRLDTPAFATVSYRYDSHNEESVSGTANDFLENQHSHVLRVELNARSFSLADEYEVTRLPTYTFLTNRLSTNYNRTVFGGARMQLSGHYTRTRFSEEQRTLHMFMTNARLATMPIRGFTLEGEAWLRTDRGNQDEAGLDSDLTGIRLKVSRHMRALTLTAGGFYTEADDNNVSDVRANVFFSLKRLF